MSSLHLELLMLLLIIDLFRELHHSRNSKIFYQMLNDATLPARNKDLCSCFISPFAINNLFSLCTKDEGTELAILFLVPHVFEFNRTFSSISQRFTYIRK